MYSSLFNQIYSLLHYSFSLFLLFLLLPRWLFKSEYEDKLEYLFLGYVKMIFLLIISGYILVLTKLYEVLSLLMLLGVIIWAQNKQKPSAQGITTTPKLLNQLFDRLDGLSNTNREIWTTSLKRKFSRNGKWNWVTVAEGVTLLFILCLSAYVRFYDSFKNAAPPLSDSYVTLAWMKYINNRDLFHDGIYPQGFHIYLASIDKFAAINALYVLRYTGPLNTLMIALGLYIVVRKLTNNVMGGLTAAWIYGIVWVVFPLFSVERQTATNSQEFAFVFIFPAIYFLIKYFQTEKREDLLVGLLCTAIIGLVHSLGFALVGFMIGVIIVSSALTLKKSWKPYIQIVAGSILAAILSFIPLVIGYLIGKNLNSSSADYLVSHSNSYNFTSLNNIDYAALASLFLLVLLQFRRKLTREERFIGIFTILTGLGVFTLYEAGAVLTHSTLIASRSSDLWGLVIPFCAGISISSLLNAFRGNWVRYLNVIVMAGIVAATIIARPTPIIPYKLEYNENIDQYLRITEKYFPDTWMIVSQDEGYSVALGLGYHMHLGDFLKNYNPMAKNVTKYHQKEPDHNIPPHIFVFQEKKVFEVSKTNSVYSILAPKYKQRAKDDKELTKWMKEHKLAGYKVKIFFENQHIKVYQLDIPRNIQK